MGNRNFTLQTKTAGRKRVHIANHGHLGQRLVPFKDFEKLNSACFSKLHKKLCYYQLIIYMKKNLKKNKTKKQTILCQKR